MYDEILQMQNILDAANISSYYLNGFLRVYEEDHITRAREVLEQVYHKDHIPEIILDTWTGYE